ncbi:hypothetical protein HK097_009454 [Rhizophlyctis rosea]|uniref:CASP C-terminal domain-containing protein n=1 Tax=Rhizophlyctis rosea TaxID=64517 RepID=A0AAD5SAJ2_9FUNG|nr:hypothetical protein HK097_009454 [Rhizophlyctis rosea]
MVNEKVAQKEAEMKETMDEKIRIYKETEHSLQRQLNQVKDQLVQLQSSHDVTQAKLVDHNQQYDEEVASKLGELEIVLMDLDRANLKIAHLEGENEVLRKEMTTSHGKNVEREWQDPSVLLERAQRLEADVTRLMAETDGLKDQLRDKGAAYAKRVSEVERDLALKNLNVAELETKLTEYEDYEKIKDELNVFKSIELDWVPDAKTNDHPLERLLLDKNKRLQAEVTSLKVDYTTISDELSATRRERDDLQNRCTQQQDLIGKLEDDLSKVNNIRETGKEAVQRPGLDPLSALVADAKLSPYDASTAARGTPVTPYTAGGSDAGAGEGNASIVPILTSQRDRYRQKNLELEQQIRNHLATISELRNDIEKLKSDNVTLYEKLRYTQSFQDGTAAAARRNEGSWRGDRSRDSGDHHVNIPLTYDQKRFTQDEVTAKYQTAYEGRLDPFRQFHKQEEARRLRNMNPAERATLNLTRLLAGNKYTRWFFVVYSLMLHMLVFATLYKLSQWEECRHDHENLLKPRDFVNGTGI